MYKCTKVDEFKKVYKRKKVCECKNLCECKKKQDFRLEIYNIVCLMRPLKTVLLSSSNLDDYVAHG